MLKFITIFWGGASPLPGPISNENYENMKLFSTLIFKVTRCIITQITMHFSASKQITVQIQNGSWEKYAMHTNLQ